MRNLLLIPLLSLVASQLIAQSDTIRILDEVLVTAYSANRHKDFVPAAVGIVDGELLNRFSTTSFLPAINTLTGVRMEERSPGSYRFSIRGSLLRSPFGIRNVKFYWNGLPITDGGGNTYFNLVDVGVVQNMEVIKGPGASLYGAGTGGVVLLHSDMEAQQPFFNYSMTAGSFGMFRLAANGTAYASERTSLVLGTSYQQAKGYRDHTELKRFTMHLTGDHQFNNKNSISAFLLASNLFYETPGGLTKEQYQDNPTQARPATSTLPGAEEQEASVKNNSTYFATKYSHSWDDHWLTTVGAYSSFTSFQNPSIRNYEQREENTIGGRMETTGTFQIGSARSQFVAGAEYQYFYSPVLVYDNVKGNTGTLQTNDELWSEGGLAFTQLEMELPSQLLLTVGVSFNFLQYKFKRLSDNPSVTQEMQFESGFFPRVALLKKFNSALTLFSSVSSGYSPPSLAEVRPSTGAFNEDLRPENGISVEVGIRGKLHRYFEYEVVAFEFNLQNAIVMQRLEDGAEYFINSGNTEQKGIETTISWISQEEKKAQWKAWINYTYHNFHFGTYVNDGIDYSGNPLTGVSPNIVVLGVDAKSRIGLYINATSTFTDRIPLNDANTEVADSNWLVGARLGLKKERVKWTYDIFAGIDNLLNQRYSLGNDLNASGGRYYNAAPAFNLYFGILVRYNYR